jgi:hypothetical protein
MIIKTACTVQYSFELFIKNHTQTLYFIARQPKYLGTLNEYTENTHLIIKAYKKYSYRDPVPLKVLTNEKRGGLAVVPFDRSRFKLFSRKFSNKSVQAPSCERHKTAPRTLFLLFANYNCFPITL